MQVGSMEEARQQVAEAAVVLGWTRLEAAIMEVAQQVLQDAEELMSGAMALDGMWTAILGEVQAMLRCMAEAGKRHGRREDDGISRCDGTYRGPG